MIDFLRTAMIPLFAFVMLWGARAWLRTGNLSATPSASPQETDRVKRPLFFWITVVPIINAGVALAIIAIFVVFAGVNDLLEGVR